MAHALSWMIFTPLIGMVIVAFIPRDKHQTIKWVSLIIASIPLLIGILLFFKFDRTAVGPQFVEHYKWIKNLNVEYFVGVDGISFIMLLLSVLINWVSVLASWGINKQVKGYFAMLLLLHAAIIGVFVALDMFLFYIFWELMLLPMYFLIGIWGGPRKEYAAIKFFLYTLVGSVLMLIAVISIYYHSNPTVDVNGNPVPHTFNLIKLMNENDFSKAAPIFGIKFTYLMFVLLFINFAIKVPMWPFHTWLPDAHVEAPTAISVILAGILLKMGTYGMFRFNYALLPDATVWAMPAIAVFGIINMIYGAYTAMAQTDFKRLVAYSSISHMGYVLFGMATLTLAGFNGAIFQMFNHGTVTAMLFILVGVIYDRAHHRDINRFGGLAAILPVYAAFTGFAFMAGLGLPGLSSFISEFFVFLGGFKDYPVLALIGVTTIIWTAGYMLWAYLRIFFGPPNERYIGFPDMKPVEIISLLPLAILVLFLGVYPMPALHLFNTGMAHLLSLLPK